MVGDIGVRLVDQAHDTGRAAAVDHLIGEAVAMISAAADGLDRRRENVLDSRGKY